MTVSERYKERYEIINGETVMMTPPAMVHQDVSSNIVSMFKIYLKGKVCRAYGDNTLVKLDDENQFMPDAMIVCDWSKINKTYIKGAPDLVVEILSPSTAKVDRTSKLEAYGKAGVKEYWIVSPLEEIVEVYYQNDGRLILSEVYSIDENGPDAEIKVSLYDDLFIKLEDVFDTYMKHCE